MESKNLPSVSVLIPTLNAARVLGKCLVSIAKQGYPKGRIEIIIADGGSTDDTLAIAKKLKVKSPARKAGRRQLKVRVVDNPLKTGEAGKAVALKHAKGELVALIDSDNFLPTKNWLRKMVAPFADPEIIGGEPWEFTYRKNDSLVNRYCALIGMNDPYCYFGGNYDRRSVLSGKWTNLRVRSEKWEAGREVGSEAEDWDYLKVQIKLPNVPTIGANGTIWRKEVLKKAVGKSKYLFDTDIPYVLAKNKSFWFAKVKVGIIHDYCSSIGAFYRKQKRRAKDFFYLESKKEREQTFQRQIGRQLYFIFSVVLILPPIIQSIKGYLRKPDLKVWLFHPLACLITLWVYGTETILAQFKKGQMSRKGWGQ